MLWRSEEEWIEFHEAVAEVEKRLGCSSENAKALLRAACADGRIYTMKAPFEEDGEQIFFMPFDEWVTIPFVEWSKRKVDCDGPDGFGCRNFVMLKQVHLSDWLEAASQAPNNPRDVTIRELLRAGQKPPATITWKEFCKEVRDKADGWVNGKPAHGFSRKNIH